MEDTIAAISTASGVGAISIVRVSGSESIDIVNKIFKGKDLKEVPSHNIVYGHIIDNDMIVDEVLVSVFRAPKSFTTEDLVEINAHGSIATTNKILELLLLNGARLAEPGEFTKRAFLNGRIDLLEAEGVMDLINSKTEKSRKLAINQLSGKVSNMIKELRNEILEILTNIEVNIDYPEYEDIAVVTLNDIVPKISIIENKIVEILKKSEDGKIIKEGLNIAILGKPNVGKSSLLNKLLDEEKAIVTDIEGTTRDLVEGKILLDSIPLNIIDTAGIRDTDDIVEKIGVDKSLSQIDKADLIIFLFDNNSIVTSDERKLYEQIKNKKHIVILNKIDLENKADISFVDEEIIKISAKDNKGIDNIFDRIRKMFNLEQFETSDLTYLTNARSISKLKESLDVINDIKNGVNNNFPVDMIEIDIKRVWDILGEITGDTYEGELINQLFSRFCLGK